MSYSSSNSLVVLDYNFPRNSKKTFLQMSPVRLACSGGNDLLPSTHEQSLAMNSDLTRLSFSRSLACSQSISARHTATNTLSAST